MTYAPAASTASTHAKPAAINAPSFSAFQAKINGASPVRRKPVPSSASIASAGSGPRQPLTSGGVVVAVGEENPNDIAHSSTSDKPNPSHQVPWLPSPSVSPVLVVRDLDQFPRGQSPNPPQNGSANGAAQQAQRQAIGKSGGRVPSPTKFNHAPLASDPETKEVSNNGKPTSDGSLQRAATMTLHPGSKPRNLHIDASQHSFFDQDTEDPAVITKTPRSPGPNKLTSFFGWKTSSPTAEDSPTYSSRHSPGVPSPLSPSPDGVGGQGRPTNRTIDVSKANGSTNNYFGDTGFSMPPPADMSAQVADMEDELREVSSELAGSIRREMELEDLVDRLQYEASQAPDMRRTSDYFSDSGTSSIRYPMSELGGGKPEDFAKQKRVSEQEKARFKLELYQKLQDERGRRKVLEMHVQHMGEQMIHIDQERAASSSAVTRIRDLESALEDSRRRLKEERRTKDNFEDLLTALKSEIAQSQNERDNLRDEVVPQLRARVEGLEAAAVAFEMLQYENASMQQELQSLKDGQSNPSSSRKPSLEFKPQPSSFGTISEEGDTGPSPISPAPRAGLTRSNSLARGNVMGGLSRTASLTRSNSVQAKDRESKENLADRVKDIEAQRDALHQALKNLLDRQKYQTKEHQKRVKALETERDSSYQVQSPRRTGYEKEVKGLKFEISQLRERANDALNGKWQCEKGLVGLKMDLDRAEYETSSLRTLLIDHDIDVPELPTRSSSDVPRSIDAEEGNATSASLQKAYTALQTSQASSISRLKELSGAAPSSAEDAQTEETMDLLIQSISTAEAERDEAQRQAQAFRAKAESLEEAENFHEGENEALAKQLRASADRVETLASQVRQQLDSNSGLRQRLAGAIGRGEAEQKASAARITGMQGKLKSLEDKLMSAQQHSEEAFARHEEEVRELSESHNAHLQRVKNGGRTPTRLNTGVTPVSPIFAQRSPRLHRTTSGIGMSMNESLRTEFLEKRVGELEAALGDADKEMQEVVQRMNMAQIEVMELQSARDDAMRQTRKLQTAINEEKQKVDSIMSPK